MTEPMQQAGLPLIFKRSCDVAAALCGLVMTAPLLAGTAAFVRWKFGSPVLFRQTRPGRRGELFQVFKFRTMTNARGPDGVLLPDAARLTSAGRLLRSLSLDELPQLWNVLRGDMSLVGPRPLLVAYLSRYSAEQMRRHEVLPGITGWSQVKGRNALSWDAKLELDVWYVDNWTPLLDLKILWMTVAAVTNRHGISQADHVTMPEFQGSAASAEGMV
jgi:lipopolysaccharide/colanic/teichoic acid biosynthesis glycosyltransferase